MAFVVGAGIGHITNSILTVTSVLSGFSRSANKCAFLPRDARRLERISRLDKITTGNGEVLRRVNEDRQILNSGKGNIDGLAMF